MVSRRTPTLPDAVSTIEFERGLTPLVAFLAVTTLWFVVAQAVLYPLARAYGLMEGVTGLAMMAASFAVVVAIAWAVLRWEGLRPPDVGLGRRNVLPGVLMVVGLYALLNVVGAAVLFLSGEPVHLAPPKGPTFGVWVAGTVAYFVGGLAEEFAFRAYLQNKLIALLGGGHDRTRKAAAILLGGVLFTLAHVPNRVIEGGLTDPGAIGATFVSVVGLGLLLGVLYEYTRNVVFVAALHGTFNWSAFVVAGMPAGDVTLLVGLPVLLAVAWYYHRWAGGEGAPEFAPQRQHRPVQ